MKKTIKTIAMLALVLGATKAIAQNVAINSTGTAPDASAMLDVSSTTKGLLIPRMTSAQRIDISSPATGLMVYQTDGTSGYYFYNGATWETFSTASSTNRFTLGSSDGDVSDWSTDLVVFARSSDSQANGLSISYDDVKESCYISSIQPSNSWKDLGLRARNTIFYNLGSTEAARITDAGYLGIGTDSPLSKLDIKGDVTLSNAGTASELHFNEPSASGSNYTSFKAQSQTGDVTYTLPSGDGTNGQVLSTNGSGALTWESTSASYIPCSSHGTNILLSTVACQYITITADITITLPEIPVTGQIIYIYGSTYNNLTDSDIDPNGTMLKDGWNDVSSTAFNIGMTLNSGIYTGFTLLYNGSNWIILSYY